MEAMNWTVSHILGTAKIPNVANLPQIVHRKK
jgi:hypothetical protein